MDISWFDANGRLVFILHRHTLKCLAPTADVTILMTAGIAITAIMRGLMHVAVADGVK